MTVQQIAAKRIALQNMHTGNCYFIIAQITNKEFNFTKA